MTVAVVRPLYESTPESLRAWRRAIVAEAVATARGPGHHPGDVAVEFYGKAAVTPTTMTSASSLTPTGMGAFLRSLRPRSAAVRLFERALEVSLAGLGQVNLPRMASFSGAGVAWI